MNRSSRLTVAAIAALVLTQPLAGCIPIGIKGQSLPWAGAATPGAARHARRTYRDRRRVRASM